MLRQGPIPQAVQGLLEYLAGFLFIAAPFLFDYTSAGVATAASIVVGILFLVLAAMSSGPTGLAKQLAPAVHALLDAVLAIVLIAAPFVLGFSSDVTPRNLFLIAGVIWLLVTIGSRYGSRPGPDAEPVAASARAQQLDVAPTAAEPRTGEEPVLETGTASTGAASTGSASTGSATTGSTTTDPTSTGTTATSSGAGTVGPDYGPLDGSGGRHPA
jgi:hypothetical protein